jgi:DUF4097 and DUF4098 domain-containing protein YvlB
MREEKMMILSMLEEGKITKEEAINLLETLEENTEKNNAKNSKAKWIRIRVFDSEENTKVNVNLPISLLDAGMKIANKFSPDLKAFGLGEEDLKEIIEEIRNGAEGKIIDVEEENGQKVEIIVE